MENPSTGASESNPSRASIFPWCIPGPTWPFRMQSAGDVHGVMLEELIRLRKDAKSDPANSLGRTLDRLIATGVLTGDEIRTLNRLVTELGADHDIPRLLAELRRLHRELLLEAKPGAISIAILSVAVDSAANRAGQNASAAKNVVKADVEGAIGGAAVGASLGGPWGAVIGGIIGGAANSLAEAFG